MTREQMLDDYFCRAQDCIVKLGSERALCRQLGIGHNQMRARIKHPGVVRREQWYAIIELHNKLGGYDA